MATVACFRGVSGDYPGDRPSGVEETLFLQSECGKPGYFRELFLVVFRNGFEDLRVRVVGVMDAGFWMDDEGQEQGRGHERYLRWYTLRSWDQRIGNS
ncbi:hypothetical protein CC80DRAFT_497993 [Byssothecium circinans]|uniref:Uncharacterized protein n=1 Tax=Byssothecium circinans TaxID=147558 RepID=A0A6A5T766_9PLEO|nr:hypothetical protein CC80DRAFT_497993 [Byssothecium circinans]